MTENNSSTTAAVDGQKVEQVTEPAMRVDARQLRCPMPLLKAKQALNAVAGGDVVEVLATDSASQKDIAAFIGMTAHKLLFSGEQNGVYRFQIQKINPNQ